MRIAILGTRGIPNHYGGFERFAEVISTCFAEEGHSVFVLSPNGNTSPVKSVWPNVYTVGIKTSAWLPPNFQTLVYDLKSLIWASKNNIDVALECGYSYAVWLPFFHRTFRKKIVTNPDGIEFHRKKWSSVAKLFLKTCEWIAVKFSGFIVCDSPALLNHYKKKYNIAPDVIPYGAFPAVNQTGKAPSEKYGAPNEYYLVISRFTPENNTDSILECFYDLRLPLVVVGDFCNKFGQKCYSKYHSISSIKFLGGIYNQDELNELREHAIAYIHGHSVGGTNPSLLEAMACKCFVVAHDNPYNRFALNNRGLFFANSKDLRKCLKDFNRMSRADVSLVKELNFRRVEKTFRWEIASGKYLEIFETIYSQKKIR